ncbi:unnamed protein product, partial [Ectocarpus sp. 12 AP-2014]
TLRDETPRRWTTCSCCFRSAVSLQVCRCARDTTIPYWYAFALVQASPPPRLDGGWTFSHTRRRNMDPNLVGPSRCGHPGCSKRPTYGIED